MPANASATSTLELFVLGPFRAVVDGAPVEDHRWTRRKPKTLVKLLALQPHARMHREEIMDVLWPDLDPKGAANNLHKTIHAARRALEPSLAAGAASRFLSTTGQVVALQAAGGLWIDAIAFEEAAAHALRRGDIAACEATLALYGGDLLVDDPYDDWVGPRRERLRALRREVRFAIARLREARRELPHAVDALKGAVLADGSDEEAHRELMRLYALAGQRRQALRQFEACREALRSELGVEPEPETVRLNARIAAGEIAPLEQGDAAGRGLSSSAPPSPASPAEGRAAAPPPPPHNLPQPMTTFVGRDAAVAEVGALLASARVLTLAGMGGMGKTRLALEVAARALADCPDGVWLAELADVKDGALVARAVATALGAREEPGRPLGDTIVDFCRPRALLILLDNCEHLVEASAELLAPLLRACPRLRVLATSREALGLPGEIVWQVPTLSLPSAGDSPERAAESEAVRLFADRVRLSSPRFALDRATAATVARLCERLDGIPLAIELAAARAKVLSVEQILEKTDDRFRLLASEARGTVARQKTLRATLDWSYGLLSDDERALFRRLSFFAGGCTLGAAERVCGEGWPDHGRGAGPAPAGARSAAAAVESAVESASAPDASFGVLDLLSRLVDKSLVTVDQTADGARYRMLETIRQYAEDRMRAEGESARLLALHRDLYLGLAERAASSLQGPDEVEALARIDAEHDNLRAALRRTIREERGATASLRLCAALWRYWHVRSHHSEGGMWIDEALAVGGSDGAEGAEPALRAQALYGGGSLAVDRGDYARADALLEACLAIRRGLGDERGTAHTLTRLGYVARCVGDAARAARYQEEALALCRRLDDLHGVAHAVTTLGMMAADEGSHARSAAYFEEAIAIYRRLGFKRGVMVTLHNLGELAQFLGETDRAEELLDESLALSRELADPTMTAYSTYVLGKVATDRGDLDRARALFASAAALHGELGDSTGATYVLDGFACVAAVAGDARRAMRLAGAAEGLRETMRLTLSAADRSVLERHLGRARAAVGPEEAARAFDAGRAMDLASAVAYALEPGAKVTADGSE